MSKESYTIDDNEMAYSSLSGRKDEPKKELVNKFCDLAMSKECIYADEIKSDVSTKYILKCKDDDNEISTIEISMHNNYKDLDNYYVKKIYSSVYAKRIMLGNKVHVYDILLNAKKLVKSTLIVGATLGAGVVSLNLPGNVEKAINLVNSNIDKVIEYDNNQFAKEIEESIDPEIQNIINENKIHSDAINAVDSDKEELEESQSKIR